jgi:hypothetical protein
MSKKIVILIRVLFITIIFVVGFLVPDNKSEAQEPLDLKYQQVKQDSLDKPKDNFWKGSWNPGGTDGFQEASQEIIEKYLPVWKSCFMKKNNVSEEYFNQHIKLTDTAISTEQSRWMAMGGSSKFAEKKGWEYFSVLYQIKIGWIEFSAIDRFAIKSEDDKEYLTQSEIEKNVDIKDSFEDPLTRIVKFVPILQPGLTFKDAVQELKQVDLPNSQYLEPYFLSLSLDQDGGVMLFGIGTIDQAANSCVQGYFNFLTKKGSTQEIRCQTE